MNPPKAGERKILPKIATDGLQIVSPNGGPLAGAGPLGSGCMLGNGGGPAAGTGIGIAGAAAAGRGGGFDAEDGEGSGFAGEGVFSAGSDANFSVELTAADMGAAAGRDLRNSEIGCHEDFASSHARSALLKLPSAIFPRMSDSEKRPASCPFR